MFHSKVSKTTLNQDRIFSACNFFTYKSNNAVCSVFLRGCVCPGAKPVFFFWISKREKIMKCLSRDRMKLLKTNNIYIIAFATDNMF